ncbi:MAG: Gfo/Idh/MocA family oxidoreductase [Planctomycetes bacterium]|nr:Gfo/Idh/MocA family oxidoreductase [Planctomycetota bacterium]
MDQIRLAFVGCGGHSSGSLQPNVPMIDEIDFVAVADLDESRGAKSAKRYGVKAYTDFKEMINTENLDAVAIVGPPEMHHQLGIECLRMGVNVFLEKPPAVTAAGAEELCAAAEESGKAGMVATMWRHDPAHKIMKQFMEDPEFGQPTFFEGHFIAPGPRSAIWGAETAFMGYLLAQGVHIVDCTRFLMGDITQVHTAAFEGEGGAVSMAVSLQFASGAAGIMGLAAAAPVLQTRMLVVGDGGGMVEVYNGNHVRASKKQSWCGTPGGYMDYPTLEWNQGWGQPGYRRIAYAEELKHFAQCLIAGEQPHASLEDSHQAMRVLEAIDESRRTGKPVEL